MTNPLDDLITIVDNPEYDNIADALANLRVPFLDTQFYVHIDALVKIMPRLKNIAKSVVPDVEPLPDDPEE